MTLRDLAWTSLANLGRHKVRTILSTVGVTVGILTIVTMVSLGVGVRHEITSAFQGAGLETIRIRPATEEPSPFDEFAEPHRTVLITPELVEALRARDDVVAVNPNVRLPWELNVALRIGEANWPVDISETPWGPQEPFSVPPEVVAGREIAAAGEGEIAVSTAILESMGFLGQPAFETLVGQDVSLVLRAPRGDVEEYPLRIVGVFKPGQGFDGPFFDAHVGTADALALKAWWYNDPDTLAHEGYDALTVKAASLNDAVQIVEELEAQGFEITTLKIMLDTINRGMIVVQTMLGSVGTLALFVASIGIANTMVMAVYERTREIGILKSVGASCGDVRRLFVVEAALIGLVGGIVGVITGWLLGLGLNELILAILRWQEIAINATFFVLTGWLVAGALAFATVVGLLAGLYPAARAARLDPLEALRHE